MSRIRAITDFPRNEQGLVDHFLGTAYDVVKFVAMNFKEIDEVYRAIQKLPQLAECAINEPLLDALEEIELKTEDEKNKFLQLVILHREEFEVLSKEIIQKLKEELSKGESKITNLTNSSISSIKNITSKSKLEINEELQNSLSILIKETKEHSNSLISLSDKIIITINKLNKEILDEFLLTKNNYLDEIREKGDSNLTKVENAKDSSLIAISELVIKSKDNIELIYQDSVNSLNSLVNSSKGDLSNLSSENIQELENKKIESINSLDSKQVTILESLNAKKEEITKNLDSKESEYIENTIVNTLGISTDKAASQDLLTRELDTVNKNKQDNLDFIGEGKVLKEGAYGLGSKSSLPNAEDLNMLEKLTGFYRVPISINRPKGSDGIGMLLNFGNLPEYTTQIFRGSLDDSAYLRCNTRGEGKWGKIFYEANTTLDSNGVIYYGNKTPIDSLNVSDMADTVIDNDKLTVTSGAVYREINKLEERLKTLEENLKQ